MGKQARRKKIAAQEAAVRPVSVAAAPLYRRSLLFFVVFSLAMLVAFWPSYYSRPGSQQTYHPHAHGIAMTLWVALLVAQAGLIRSGRRDLHRKLGVVSYALVPAIVIATINFLHFRVRGATELPPFALHFVALVLNALVAFVALWGIGIYYRRSPATHARYMIATVFPLFTPVTDRLIGRYVPSIAPLVPRIDGSPVLPFAGFLLADAMLIGLTLWDWRVNRRKDVFPVALAVLVCYHVSVMTFHRFGWWNDFALWFAKLPLS
ncbi:MAG TPA: hypothetical protein VFY29_07350 [Terriglobia bacterium]|nr:hypothetical protein [Terriglobia bacterium]